MSMLTWIQALAAPRTGFGGPKGHNSARPGSQRDSNAKVALKILSFTENSVSDALGFELSWLERENALGVIWTRAAGKQCEQRKALPNSVLLHCLQISLNEIWAEIDRHVHNITTQVKLISLGEKLCLEQHILEERYKEANNMDSLEEFESLRFFPPRIENTCEQALAMTRITTTQTLQSRQESCVHIRQVSPCKNAAVDLQRST